MKKFSARISIYLVLCALSACASKPLLPQKPVQAACASAHALATQACVSILNQGGNAFDAAIATSAALAVVEPFGSGLGGGGFFLLHDAQQKKDVFLDGRERAPRAAKPDMFLDKTGAVIANKSLNGALAAGIPHQVALLDYTAQHYASLPLATLLAPAIAAAQNGFTVDWHLADLISAHANRMDAQMQAVFLPKGKALAKGDVLIQAELAQTLKRFAQNGGAEFNTGLTAQRLLKGVQDGSGIWQASDLANIKVSPRAPLVGQYGAYTITTAPPPSAGGSTILQTLALLQNTAFSKLDTLEGTHLFIEALRRAYRDRNQYFGDPDFITVPVAALLNKQRLQLMAKNISASATPSAQLAPAPLLSEGEHTSHFCVIDAKGNRVSATQSLNYYFGAGLMPQGTGVILNDTMDDFSASIHSANVYGLAGSAANAIAGEKIPVSSMSPSFVEGNQQLLITGTPGGSAIPSMVLIAILKFTDGASAAQITAHPRIHHQWMPDVLQFEPNALSSAQQTALHNKGHVLKELKEAYGNLSAIRVNFKTGQSDAAADPRWVGTSSVLNTR